MDYSNMDYPVNIHQIYEHLFNGQELDDNKKKYSRITYERIN